MVHESLDSARHFYALGALLLVIAIVCATAGTLIKRRLEEAQRDERYVRERRGEEVETIEPPRIADVLQYAGVVVGALAIVLLVIGWTVAPGKS
ncbi:MAG: hypothetical protein QM729_13685 [Solirubrobacterales bacterium]